MRIAVMLVALIFGCAALDTPVTPVGRRSPTVVAPDGIPSPGADAFGIVGWSPDDEAVAVMDGVFNLMEARKDATAKLGPTSQRLAKVTRIATMVAMSKQQYDQLSPDERVLFAEVLEHVSGAFAAGQRRAKANRTAWQITP